MFASLGLLAVGALPTWLVVLETGPTPGSKDPAVVQEQMKGHFANFNRIHSEGRMTLVGPVTDARKVKRGIILMQAESEAAVHEDMAKDSLISGRTMIAQVTKAEIVKGQPTGKPDPSAIEEHRVVFLERASGAAPSQAAALWGKTEAWMKNPSNGFILCVALGDQGAEGAFLVTKAKDTEKVMAAACRFPCVQAGLLKPVVIPGYFSKNSL